MQANSNYSLFSNMKFMLGNLFKWNGIQAGFVFLHSPILVAISLTGIYLSREVINAVIYNRTAESILFLIAGLSMVLVILAILDKLIFSKISSLMMAHDFQYSNQFIKKCISSDYENMENPEGLNRANKAMQNTSSTISVTRQVAHILSSLLKNIIGIVSFGGLLFALSPVIVAVIFLTSIAGFYALKIPVSWGYRNRDNWEKYERKLNYLGINSGDFTRAKDLRLYSMGEWFSSIFRSTIAERMVWHKKEQMVGFGADGLRLILSLIREGVSYAFLIYLVFTEGLSAGDFVLYFGMISGLTVWMNGAVQDFSSVHRFHISFTEIREFLDYPDKSNHGEGSSLPEGTFSIEFKNVSYKHSGSDTEVIKQLSFKIAKGEKLAIVGLNGAGKTTIVKLICGLYRPTTGEILINGQPQDAFNKTQYYSLFSVVFQEIFLMPLSIARNISCKTGQETNRSLVQETLEAVGLNEKVDSLPESIDTKLIKSVYSDAIDFSGGEIQKLAMARALYKKGKALILDEPTAALDPIAESDIYEKYNEMAAGRTSLFISHRLASTQFCDRIFYLENGEIAESGNHDELMSQKGKYFEMFEIQSHYYKEDSEGGS